MKHDKMILQEPRLLNAEVDGSEDMHTSGSIRRIATQTNAISRNVICRNATSGNATSGIATSGNANSGNATS